MIDHKNEYRPLNNKYILAFDTETFYNTKEKKQEFILGTIVLKNLEKNKISQEVYYSKQKMAKELLRIDYTKNQSVNVAFNAQFDLYTLPLAYSKYFSDYSKGRVYIARYLRASNILTKFLDVANFFSGGLADVGALFQCEKMAKPKWLGKRSYATQAEQDYLEQYCIRDSLICLVATEWLIERFKTQKTGLCITPSQYTYRNFVTNHLKHKIYTNSIEEQLALFRPFYLGGRTEAFTLGHIDSYDTIRSYDFNSAYVYCMSQMDIPITPYTKLAQENIKKTLQNFQDNHYCLFAHVKIKDTQKGKVGLIPTKLFNMIFPKGTFETGLFSHEIALLQDSNIDFEVKRLWAAKGDPIFREYAIETFRKKQQAENLLMRNWHKLEGNGLYGKFSQLNELLVRKPEFDYLHEPFVVDLSLEKNNELIKLRFYYGKAYQKTMAPSRHLAIPISAEITSAQRAYLTNHLLQYEDDVLYCDTDSFMVGDTKINESDSLGGLKLEAEGTSVKIFKEKMYQIYNNNQLVKYTTKGFPKKAIYNDKTKKIEMQFDNVECQDFTVQFGTLLSPKLAWIQRKHPYEPVTVTKSFSLLANPKRQLKSFDFTKTIETTPYYLS